jgi:hypothetical protein
MMGINCETFQAPGILFQTNQIVKIDVILKLGFPFRATACEIG